MRLFVAVTPPPAALAHLADALEPVRATAPAALRWAPPERWHVTLAFLGEVAEDRVPALTKALRAALADCAAPTLALAGGGAFGRSVLWLGLSGDVPLLERAARAAARAARAVRVPLERRPFRAHLTVARVRGAADLRPAREALREYQGPPWPAPAAELVRSHLGPTPRHEVLAGFPLAGHAGDET